MTDFCRSCSIEYLGKDTRALAGLCTPVDAAHERFAEVFCDGCGPVQVDHDGCPIRENRDATFASNKIRALNRIRNLTEAYRQANQLSMSHAAKREWESFFEQAESDAEDTGASDDEIELARYG